MTILAVVWASTAADASTNLITNGSFEAGNTGWTSLSCGAVLENSTNAPNYGIPAAPNGTHFIEVECNSLVPTSTADYVQQTVATTNGETYIVSIQAVTRSGINTQDRLIINAAGTNISSVTTTGAWVNYSGAFTASSASSVIRYVSNGSVAGGGTAPGDSIGLMVDDAQVQELTVSPASASTTEDTSIVFNTFNGNAFQVASNSTAATLTAAFAVTKGKLTLASTLGLTFTLGSNGSASFTISGTAAAINTALGLGLTYAPTADYNGSDTLTFTATAGAATDTDTVPITITPVADIVADSVVTTENVAITYNAITGTNGASADSFENTPTAVTVTAPVHGTAVASLITLGQITYTPNAGWFGTDTFNYTVTSGGVTETATETVTVNPLSPAVTISKVSNGGTGTFNFTGSNGISNQAITTVTAGTPVSGTSQTLTATGVATTVTETIPPTYFIASASCIDTNSTNTGKVGSFGTLVGGTLTIPAANIVMGAAITCTFNNTFIVPSLQITKTYATAPTPVVLGQTVTYTYVIANNGNVTMSNVQVKDMHGTPAVQIANGAGGVTSETLTAVGSGGSSDATANDGIWSTLTPGAAVTFTYTHTVTQAEIDHG